jgi:uncharacterized protein YjbJ (UPF0337 family)
MKHGSQEHSMARVVLVFVALVLAVAFARSAEAAAGSPLKITQADLVSIGTSNLVLILNQDQFAGSWNQFKGELKQRWGKFTDDDLLYIEGKYDKYEGKLQERYGDRTEEIKQWTDDWFTSHGSEQKKPSPDTP